MFILMFNKLNVLILNVSFKKVCYLKLWRVVRVEILR